MREKILFAGAVAALALAGALFGGGAVYTFARMNGLQAQHDAMIVELNQKILPEIQKKLDVAVTAPQDASKTSKK